MANRSVPSYLQGGLFPYRPQALVPIFLGTAGIWAIGSVGWLAAPAMSQISGDDSFGTRVNGDSVAPCVALTCTVEGGTLNAAQSTLLHSFETFSLPAPEQSVLFVAPSVESIVVRVTGASESFVNGLIQTSTGSAADLFLINPSGIRFGPGAQLAIGGSFLASTAQELMFDSGAILATGEASQPTDSLLSINTPIGLGFLPNEPSRPITVQGPGHLLVFGAPNTPSAFVNRAFQMGGGLSVPPSEAIALVANGINLSGANLTAAGGRIELGSVSAGRVSVASNAALDYAQVDRLADISFSDRTLLEASASRPGQIRLRGQNIDIAESTALLAEVLPEPPGSSPAASATATPGDLIDIQATGTVTVRDFDAGGAAPPFHSYLSVDVAPDATRPGGTLRLQAETLQVETGAQLGANTFGRGDAGQLALSVANTTLLSGESPFSSSGLFATADGLGSGDGGQISLKTGQLIMEQGAQILTNSLNQGVSGSIGIEAERVSLNGTGAPFSPPPGFSSGGPGAAPSPPILVSPTLIQSGMGPVSRGQGGGIRIEAQDVSITEGAEIVTGTLGGGAAGPLTIRADDIALSGFSPIEGPSGLFTTVGFGAAGSGGPLDIEANRLQVLSGAQIATSTVGSGRAGDLSIRGGDVRLAGQTPQGRSGLFATAIGDRGAGGNLSVTANSLQVEEGATVSVSNFPSGESAPIPPGRGPAGNLQISADRVFLRDGASLSADTVSGDRGNIGVQTDALTLRRGSRITTNATGTATGGNIRINADFVVARSEENSDITANAVFGDGGQINISARQVLGLTERPQLTAESDITASSEFGLAGETRLETPESAVRPGTEPLPQSTEVATVLQGCSATDSSSQFIQSGQGGLSTSPYGILNSRESLGDVSLPSALAELAPAETSSAQMVEEAQGWGLNEQGEVVLSAAMPEQTLDQCSS